MKSIFYSSLLLLLFSCNRTPQKTAATETINKDTVIRLRSKAANDSFTVFISLPPDYTPKQHYPVIYLLDANFYFEMIAPVVKQYAKGGLMPSVIVAGIGYKDFETMDSLRDRDFTYPKAIPEYEMAVSGNANNFLSFISKELIPEIDARYATDTNQRILMGHSLGGYFTLYSLYQSLVNHNHTFSSYIAASPSTDYNHGYLLNELSKLQPENWHQTKAFITFGGLEDEEDAADEPATPKVADMLGSLQRSLKEKNKLNYHGEIYSNLAHMDTPLPSFIKGIQWSLGEKE